MYAINIYEKKIA